MSKCDIVNSVNKIKWLFREYGALNVTEVFLFDVSVFFLKWKLTHSAYSNKYPILNKSPSFVWEKVSKMALGY